MFGSKGGVGKTTIATNLAVALRQHTRQRVALFDADLFFGDVGVHLNLPTVRTILDMIQSLDGADPEQAEQVLVPHPSGVRVLLSPFRPEEGELITPESIERILEFLRQHYDYIVVDCQPSYDDRMLRILESADEVLMVVTPEVGPLKNTSLFLDLAVRLGYSLDKINVALNRFNSNVGIGPEEIERTLQHEVAFRIISGGRPVVLSVNRGVPLVIEQPDHPFSVQIMRIADHYIQRALNGPSQAPSRSLRGRSAEAEG
jgi:pilus assembly protein CpaE